MVKYFILASMISSLLYSQEAKAEEKPTPAKQPKATEKPKKKTMEEALKNTIEKAGLFNLYQDTTSGKTYMLIKKDQLEKEFIHFVHGFLSLFF